MCTMLDTAFFAPSPKPYIRIPQATEQYGQVLRVSVIRASLYCRTCATAASGAAPNKARLELASVVPETLKNWRRFMCCMRLLPGHIIGATSSLEHKRCFDESRCTPAKKH